MRLCQFAVLSLWCLIISEVFAQSSGQANGFQSGKVNISGISDDSCKVYCTAVTFPRTFTGSRSVRVLASVRHGEVFSKVHDPSVLWTESVTASGFRVCVQESGSGTNGSVVINWLAFQDTPSGYLSGSVSFGLFTSGTTCKRINFPQLFPKAPRVIATSRHTTVNRPEDAMNLWLEDIHRDYFRVCLKEVKSFDGKHNNIEVNWLAFVDGGDSIVFRNLAAPPEKDNFAYCQVVNFTSKFYAAPVVIATANHVYDSNNAYSVKPENNAINCWIEEITKERFRACVKDNAGMASQHDPITVDYIVLGDLEPCLSVTCEYYAVCKAFGPKDARCVCDMECPSYDEPVCSSNGTTYDNKCVFKREMCLLAANYTLYHPGSCTGFPMEKGRRSLKHLPSWSEVICSTITFSPQIFYPDKPVHVQATVNHVNSSHSAHVHEAAVVWVEKVLATQFRVCVTKAGRNDDRSSGEFATIDWMGYQGAPEGGVAGETDIPRWWTGTTCRTVNLPRGKFSVKPTVLLTAEHGHHGLKHDAAVVWAQDITANSFDICIRELQNFDGVHDNIHVNWLAFQSLHRPLFSELGSVYFPNTGPLQQSLNFAFCKDVHFTVSYNDTPVVLITANHSTGGGNLAPVYNAISSWVEYINKTGFRTCVKELYVNKYDPLSVSYAVLADVCPSQWSYFNGSCYYTSSFCDSWSRADSTCRDLGANLASVESQEENVFLQRRHNGATAWIGLNDIASEGNFRWIDGCKGRYRFWAKNQPNNMKNQDCVHTLGITHGYTWNDVSCSNCNNFTCKKDYNECASSPCRNGGTYQDGARNYTCICPAQHMGRQCENTIYCVLGPCQNGATCVDLVNDYRCTCAAGSRGKNCDIINFSARFTTLGASGRLGPISLGSHYRGQPHDGQVTLSSGIQLWRVPYTGKYRIEAVGATAGYDTARNSISYRGRGARMMGTFSLNRGEVLKILVGQEGGINTRSRSSGGGGGTFITRQDNTPLIVAGGGGGIESASSRHSTCDASSGTSGNAGYGGSQWPGGSGGHGANTADRSNSGGGGGGFYSNGRSSRNFGGSYGKGGEGGRGFIQGGVGGNVFCYKNVGDGGFGGGGGAYGCGGGAGGGGGYSGGASGDNNSYSCGGGGGSYNSGTQQTNTCCYNNRGHGYVVIAFI